MKNFEKPPRLLKKDSVESISDEVPTTEPTLKKPKIVRSRVERIRIGEKNEVRFYELADKLIKVLTENFSETVLHGNVTRSAHKSLQDLTGEDVRISLEARTGPTHPIRRGYGVYDVKSSEAGVLQYNELGSRRSLMSTGHRGALFRKSIKVNDDVYDKQIVSQIIKDFADGEILPVDLDFEYKVLDYFK